jgi:Fic family protein
MMKNMSIFCGNIDKYLLALYYVFLRKNMMAYNKDVPYNDLPLLPPRFELETKVVLKKAISATAALAELRGIGNQIPNQSMLIRAFVLQEARLSSEIENVVTTNDELYKAFADVEGKFDAATKEVLYYENALWHGYQIMKERPLLTTNLFIQIAEIIKRLEGMGVRSNPGTKLANPITGDVVYTPPEGEDLIRTKLANLEEFIHSDDELDPLVRMAVMHYQFEAIHPFHDGNGRTGRILNILYLLKEGMLDIPVLYLSRYIIENKNAYYEGLKNVTENQAWEAWILYMLNAVEKTAKATSQKILAIRALMHEYLATAQEKLPKIYSKDLIEVLFSQPYCRIKFLEQAGIAKRQAASNYLQQLEGIGLVRGVRLGREVYYVNDRLYALLTS